MLFGDNGLIGKAKQAVEKYKEAQEEEAARMKELDDSAYGEMYEGKDDSTPGEMAGDGTTKNPYLIQSIEDLVFLANQVNSGTETYKGQEIKLMVDLDFNSSDSYTNPTAYKEKLTTGAGFTPIGTNSNLFQGNFNGNNKKISNLHIENNTLSALGLFGCISNSGINNLTLTGNINTSVGADCGGLVGNCRGSCNLINIKNYTNIKSSVGVYSVGGLVGSNVGTLTIGNSVNKGNVDNSNNTGGLVGYHSGKLLVEHCYNEGNVTNTKGQQAGGLLGRDAVAEGITTTIVDSYNKGNVTSNKEELVDGGDGNNIFVGGLIGIIYSTVSIDESYNEGKVQNLKLDYSRGYALCVGGLVGEAMSDTVIKNSYNLGAILNGTKMGGIIALEGGNMIVDKCYNSGEISANEKLVFLETATVLGGIMGATNGAGESTIFILNSYNTGNIDNKAPLKSASTASGIMANNAGEFYLINSYNKGNVNSLFSSNGLVYTSNNCHIYNSYNIGEITSSTEFKYGIGDIRTNGAMDGEYIYYLDNVENGTEHGVVGQKMTAIAMKDDSFVKQLNDNIKNINLTEISSSLSEYKLVNWKKGDNGYPIFQ